MTKRKVPPQPVPITTTIGDKGDVSIIGIVIMVLFLIVSGVLFLLFCC